MEWKLRLQTALSAPGARATTTGRRVDRGGAQRAVESPPKHVAVADVTNTPAAAAGSGRI